MKNPNYIIHKQTIGPRGYRSGFRLSGQKTKMATLYAGPHPAQVWNLFHLNADKTKQYLKRYWLIEDFIYI